MGLKAAGWVPARLAGCPECHAADSLTHLLPFCIAILFSSSSRSIKTVIYGIWRLFLMPDSGACVGGASSAALCGCAQLPATSACCRTAAVRVW